MDLSKKEIFLDEFSLTIKEGDNKYLSFYPEISVIEEFEILFDRIVQSIGKSYFPIYRMCDAEYMYCVGRKTPPHLSLFRRLKYSIKTQLINSGLMVQRTGHQNFVKKEMWFGEYYSLAEKKKNKEKFLRDLKMIAEAGYMAPYLVYSKNHFCEEYFMPMLDFLKKVNIGLTKTNYFPFHFVYMMLNLQRYKKLLYENKNILIVTAFNERNKIENFEANLKKENVKSVSFYNISHDKSMLEKIEHSKISNNIDVVLIGAGIGSANIMNQLSHLKAVCIDAGHALDCISRPELRKERFFLLPDVEINS